MRPDAPGCARMHNDLEYLAQMHNNDGDEILLFYEIIYVELQLMVARAALHNFINCAKWI